MAKTKVKSIKELFLKIEKNEKKRCSAEKELSDGHKLLMSRLQNINAQSSPAFSYFIDRQFEFCLGFLHGLSAVHYITGEELFTLLDELSSAHDAYHERAKQAELEAFESMEEEAAL